MPSQFLRPESSQHQVTALSVSGMRQPACCYIASKGITLAGAQETRPLPAFRSLIFPCRIASIDFAPPYILSGSSDTHLRLFNVLTSHGWCTSPYFEPYARTPTPSTICQTCGGEGTCPDMNAMRQRNAKAMQAHRGLVRSVALGDQYVLSGSYDQTIKVYMFGAVACLQRADVPSQGVGPCDGRAHCRFDGGAQRQDLQCWFRLHKGKWIILLTCTAGSANI